MFSRCIALNFVSIYAYRTTFPVFPFFHSHPVAFTYSSYFPVQHSTTRTASYVNVPENVRPLPSRQKDFFKILTDSLQEEEFLYISLHDNVQSKTSENTLLKNLKSVYGRLVLIKAGLMMQITYRYLNKDIIKNIVPSETSDLIESLLSQGFQRCSLSTKGSDYDLLMNGDVVKMKTKMKRKGLDIADMVENVNSSSASVVHLSHDRTKPRLLNESLSFFQELGITTNSHRPRAGMVDKFRQIQKFAEVLDAAVDKSVLISFRKERNSTRINPNGDVVIDRPLHVVDVGCGMGYLTFAAHALLSQKYNVRTRGVEIRQELVDETNRIAKRLGRDFERLDFQQGDISALNARNHRGSSDNGAGGLTTKRLTLRPLSGAVVKREEPAHNIGDLKADIASDPVDILIALHACDTATDEAIGHGVRNNAAVILTAPCCHKEVRRQLDAYVRSATDTSLGPLNELIRHGIFRERQAEMVTDTIRGLCLELCGYSTTAFEFVGGEHTAKNVMMCAVKRRLVDEITEEDGVEQRERLWKRMNELMALYGVKEQRLVSLMKQYGPGPAT